jgi:hypothetical protein
MPTPLRTLAACALIGGGLVAQTTWYVSAARGAGAEGSKQAPVRDLGVLLPRLRAGDTVCIAGGAYTGRDGEGCDRIVVPCTLLGGWNDDFTARDPWGAFRTCLVGDLASPHWNGGPRLWFECHALAEPGAIVVDGIVVDEGSRNRYHQDDDLRLVRRTRSSTAPHGTPETPGILVELPPRGSATIRHCVVVNAAPTAASGAIHVVGNARSQALLHDNLVANSTGAGIHLTSRWHPRGDDGVPRFEVRDNTVVFTWAYDPAAPFGGSALRLDSDLVAAVVGNVFAFADGHGVDNGKRARELTLRDNLFGPSLGGDYLEQRSVLGALRLDEARMLAAGSTGNLAGDVELRVDPTWSARYVARPRREPLRAGRGAMAPVPPARDLCTMLGINEPPAGASDEVWLPRLRVDDAIAAGARKQRGRHGCSSPANDAMPGK